jgi:hypothetical protein
MAVARRTAAVVTDPATLPGWVLYFHAAEEHWMSLVDPKDQPADYTPHGRSWAFWQAERIYREVSKEWLIEHAPDLNLYDLWDEDRRRSGHKPIHRRASAQLQAAAKCNRAPFPSHETESP